MKKSEIIASKYVIGKKIINATRSYEAINKITGQTFAVKIYDMNKISNFEFTDLEERIKTIQSIRLPFIVQIVEVVKQSSRLYVFQEFVENGSIKPVAGLVTNKLVFTYIRQITQALLALNTNNQVYSGYLALENLYLSKQGTLKIQMLQWRPRELLSPEQALGQRTSTKTDVFQFGLLINVLLTGDPLPCQNNAQELKNMKTRVLNTTDSFMGELITSCCIKDQNKRPTIKQIFETFLWLSAPDYESAEKMASSKKQRQVLASVRASSLGSRGSRKIPTLEDDEDVNIDELVNNGQNVKLSIRSMIRQPVQSASALDTLDNVAILGEMDPEQKAKFTEFWKGVAHGRL